MLIKNCRDANGSLADIPINGALIADGAPVDSEVFDAGGLTALPAFVDIHCHLRDPGFEYKEDIASGTLAALCGGYRAVAAMPNTLPVTDNPETLRYVAEKARQSGHCGVYPTAAITVGQKGRELVDFDALHAAGAAAFTDDGHPVSDPAVMLEAMRRCAARDYLIISHPEELALSKGGVMNEGETAKRLGLKGIPDLAEDLAIIRDIAIAESTGCRLHLAHISTRAGMQAVREAKARGVRVTAETCPHYFTFSDEDVVYYGSSAKMSPPLRSKDDVRAVIEAIRDGTVDCISTDHAPHAPFEKDKPISEAPNGVIGLQTAFSAAYTRLVRPGYIDLKRLCALMAYNPARLLGFDASLTPGNPASVALVDEKESYVVTENLLRSKSRNTPFIGMSLWGAVKHVFIDGERKL